jgi:hypothetical protein
MYDTQTTQVLSLVQTGLRHSLASCRVSQKRGSKKHHRNNGRRRIQQVGFVRVLCMVWWGGLSLCAVYRLNTFLVVVVVVVVDTLVSDRV